MIKVLLFSLFLLLSTYTYAHTGGLAPGGDNKCSKAFAKGGGADVVDNKKDSATPQTPQVKNKSNLYNFQQVRRIISTHNVEASSKGDRIESLSAYNKLRASDPRLPSMTTLRKQFKEFAATHNVGNASLSDILFFRIHLDTKEIQPGSVTLQGTPKDVKSETSEQTESTQDVTIRQRERRANWWYNLGRLTGTRTMPTTDQEVQALTKSEVQAIPPRHIVYIQRHLLPKQVPWLNEKQLDKTDMRLFNQKQTRALTPEQLSLDSVLKAISTKGAQYLTIKQVLSIPINKLHLIQSKLSAQQLEKKVQGLTKDDLDQLSVEQMRSIQKYLSLEQMVGLKEEHLDNLIVRDLTPEQVEALSEASLLRALPQLLNGAQLQQASNDYIEHITGNALNKMSVTQLKAIQTRLSSSQLNQLKKKLFKDLSFELLTVEQVENLPSRYLALAQSKINSELIPSISRLVSDFKIERMTTQQIQAMHVEQLHAVLNKMSGRQIQVLTNEQVDGLLEDSVGLSSRNLRHLRKNLSVRQIFELPQEKKDNLNFKGFTNVARLRQLQVGGPLTAREVRRLIRYAPEMAYVLSADHLNNLSKWRFLSKWRLRNIQRYLLPEQIASLSRDTAASLNLKLLSTVQVQAFTSRQLNFFEAGQLRDIQRYLLPSQIADLSTSTLTKLSLKKLSKQQVEALTLDQLKGLGYERVYPIWDKLLPEQQQIPGWQPALRRQR